MKEKAESLNGILIFDPDLFESWPRNLQDETAAFDKEWELVSKIPDEHRTVRDWENNVLLKRQAE